MSRFLLLFLLLWTLPVHASVVDRIAAVVNGHVITEGELEEYLRVQRTMVPGGEALEANEALDSLIEQTLAQMEAERLGVKPSDEEVGQAIDEIRARNNLGPDEFRRALESQGLGYPAYVDQVRDQLLRVKVTSRVLRDRLSVSDEDLREFYLKNVAQYCESPAVKLLHLEVGEEESGREKAEAVRAEVLAGEDFETAGAVEGESPRDLGYVLVENLSRELRAVLKDLPAGEVSPVVELQGTCHLFYVEDRREGRIRPFEEVREQLRQRYFEVKEEELFRTWVDSLVENAHIERKIEG